MDLHDNILEELKCSKCGSFLSCAPVFVTLTGENICGRCPRSDDSVRNKVYEALASVAKFPCRYKQYGCAHSTKWNSKHEENCDFRLIKCFQTKCIWQGNRTQLVEHFKDKHEDSLTLKQPLTVSYDLTNDSEKNILMSIFGFIFLIQVKIAPNLDKIWHCIRYLGNSNCISQFYCTIKISKNSACFTDIIPMLPQGDTWDIPQDKGHECDITGLQSVLKGMDDIYFTISINKKINLQLLNNMKCLICRAFTRPPIFHIGESPVCAQCAPSGCQINPDLTSLGLQLLYPCIHKNKGCCNFDNLKYIWKHEMFSCKFFYCFICNQDLEGNIETHFKKKHSVKIISLEEMMNIELDDYENWFLITNDDNKFLGQYVFDENVLEIMLCSNLTSELLNNTTCNLKMIDFKSKKTVVKNMTPKMQDAYDWAITLNSKELSNLVTENRINIQFELFKTVSAE